jgi:GAF domain-containing protein
VSAVLDTILGSAAGATAAGRGWILGRHADGLEVLAAVGVDDLVGAVVAPAGTAGYVVASGQPVATVPRREDASTREGIFERVDPPSSVLSVPCARGDDVLAVLELVDQASGGFTFDDIEIATMLADIVAAVVQNDAPSRAVRSPAELHAELRRLATTDAERYAEVAVILDALLARD